MIELIKELIKKIKDTHLVGLLQYSNEFQIFKFFNEYKVCNLDDILYSSDFSNKVKELVSTDTAIVFLITPTVNLFLKENLDKADQSEWFSNLIELTDKSCFFAIEESIVENNLHSFWKICFPEKYQISLMFNLTTLSNESTSV